MRYSSLLRRSRRKGRTQAHCGTNTCYQKQIRSTLTRHLGRFGQHLTRKQVRAAAFFTLSRVLRRRPKAEDCIHVPQMQAAILEDAMDEATRQSLQEFATLSAKIRSSGRTTNQKECRFWKDRLRKARQEVWCGSEPPRYVLCEDIRAEVEANARGVVERP